MSDTSIRTVIIPAAGLGTRLLPATKVTAKELLPVYDRVVLDFAIEEAIGLGAERIVVVISTAKVAIQAYLASKNLQTAGHDESSSAAQKTGPQITIGPKIKTGPQIMYVFQDRPLGLGHAVLCCRDVTLPGPFAVLLPDDIVMGPNCLSEMSSQYASGHMVAAMQVKAEETSQYGIFRLGGLPRDRCLPVSGMVEKPAPGTAPSSYAAVGRYILDPLIFDVLDNTPSGKGGEVQLTDAIAISGRAIPVVAFRFSGTRHDCGNHDGLLAASLARQDVTRQENAVAEYAGSHSPTPQRRVVLHSHYSKTVLDS
ncbi:MAG: sugar phosphate nucleotidyltransferase [Pseudotabrizicola sp.]|uniref:UTP--glucose-1-phosphate uridylyltransferase n=1 Tax=Pseudotabrizicola sp. TaxID=2939647 RepID=UPI0027228DFB|nr:sugar phosphate nucleotidyltransferase [Pseudotabrizicola sp.]MDO8883334.1 sugar phosphate nucleotidyltransferase [Pseudotabrizicola sp.]MDP2082403.1 sugar phosphate nucleotidyltransferase [Pseudotabrizicola sp.]MDZ7574156.1 sugar phosphate nucleotidyltransferase [Pseudotabrizicola sp.]